MKQQQDGNTNREKVNDHQTLVKIKQDPLSIKFNTKVYTDYQFLIEVSQK